jgi:hypothetical protein
MSWPAHPDDELVEITAFGATEPEYIRGHSAIGAKVNEARALYIDGAISAEELERRIDAALASVRPT